MACCSKNNENSKLVLHRCIQFHDLLGSRMLLHVFYGGGCECQSHATFIGNLQVSLYSQPKQCTIIGEIPQKLPYALYCIVWSPQYGKFNDPWFTLGYSWGFWGTSRYLYILYICIYIYIYRRMFLKRKIVMA